MSLLLYSKCNVNICLYTAAVSLSYLVMVDW